MGRRTFRGYRCPSNANNGLVQIPTLRICSEQSDLAKGAPHGLDSDWAKLDCIGIDALAHQGTYIPKSNGFRR